MICEKCAAEQEYGTTCDSCQGHLILWEYPINLNKDDWAILQILNGVGPQLAEDIVSSRPIKRFEDIPEISGISSNMINEWKPYVKL